MKLRLVFEDEHLVVADKPVGLLTIATETEKQRTLYSALRDRAQSSRPPHKIFVVHRLDREASGLVVFAKTTEAKERLQAQFKDHSAGRTYVALVEGVVPQNQFTIRSHLAENAAHRVYASKTPSKTSKLAITHVTVLKRRARATLLEIRLETGRKHQIRVHLADRGFPIAGDRFYGSRTNPIRRLALHGARLEFRHPATGNLMSFTSPYPPGFEF